MHSVGELYVNLAGALTQLRGHFFRLAVLRWPAILAIAAFAALSTSAAETAAPPPLNSNQPPAAAPAPSSPDIGNGREIATKGIGCGQAQPCFPCFTCHGRQGAGDPGAHFPRLSHQSFEYLYSSLRNFASGARKSPIMQSVASRLDDKAMRDVAGFYATSTPETEVKAAAAAEINKPDYRDVIAGGVLAAVGDMSHGIQGCQNCHGPHGSGLPPTFPYLAGQYPDYLEGQLRAWKTGARKGDPLGIMRDIAARMTDQEIHQAAVYYASIAPSRPVPEASIPDTVMALPVDKGGAQGEPAVGPDVTRSPQPTAGAQ